MNWDILSPPEPSTSPSTGFPIGFGRAIASWRDKSGVEWRIGWLRAGWLRCASPASDNRASIPDQTDLEALRSEIRARRRAGRRAAVPLFQAAWQRTLIVLAGPRRQLPPGHRPLRHLSFGAFGQPR